MSVPQNALFVCFGCLSNVGTLTGLAGAGWLLRYRRCWTRPALPGGSSPWGCPLDCACKIVERAGFTPDRTINLVQDCGLKKGPPLEYSDEDLQVAAEAILSAVHG